MLIDMKISDSRPHKPLPTEERLEKLLSALQKAGSNRLEREMYYGREVTTLETEMKRKKGKSFDVLSYLDRRGLRTIGSASEIETDRTKMRANEIRTYQWLAANWDAVLHFKKVSGCAANTGPAIRRSWNVWVDEQYLKQGKRRSKYVSDAEWAASGDRISTRDERAEARQRNEPKRILKQIAKLPRSLQLQIKKSI